MNDFFGGDLNLVFDFADVRVPVYSNLDRLCDTQRRGICRQLLGPAVRGGEQKQHPDRLGNRPEHIGADLFQRPVNGPATENIHNETVTSPIFRVTAGGERTGFGNR